VSEKIAGTKRRQQESNRVAASGGSADGNCFPGGSTGQGAGLGQMCITNRL